MMRCFLASALMLVACNGNQVGNPPFAPEEFEAPFDPAMGTVMDNPVMRGTFDVTLPHVEGAAALDVINLTRTDGAVSATRSDEGWTASLAAAPGDVLRVVVNTEPPHAPFDLVFPELAPLTPPRCLRVEARDFTSPELLRLRNDCDENVVVEGQVLFGSWSVFDLPATVAPAEVIELLVAPESDEVDYLLLETGEERVALTLRP